MIATIHANQLNSNSIEKIRMLLEGRENRVKLVNVCVIIIIQINRVGEGF